VRLVAMTAALMTPKSFFICFLRAHAGARGSEVIGPTARAAAGTSA
jgi:hypothetical protein